MSYFNKKLTVERRPIKLAPRQSNNYNAMTDEELVIACQRRQKGAIDCLLKRHKKMLAGMLYKLAPDLNSNAADILQEVYIRVWRSIGQLRNAELLKSWLHKIVIHLFYDELRKQPRQYQFVSIDEPIKDEYGSNLTRDISDSTEKHPETIAISHELSRTLLQALSKLPERFRTAVILRDLEGFSYEEIADLTATDLGTVKSRISRGRHRIKKQITHYWTDCA
jgi:RNA polymerase sigma-70 factor, ECF subfamily